ncbi:hypothetical protein MA16_Dca028276 [Dendrobium catenatum]|uniref:Uncharacterized protein n=1 Tax=Dendrobium catenatum TaxID=906689 RepID=A0A2I0VC79_9ASPA|nr:hypothetical protein MA16_Dca028276 [Dendrobium catenatum]
MFNSSSTCLSDHELELELKLKMACLSSACHDGCELTSSLRGVRLSSCSDPALTFVLPRDQPARPFFPFTVLSFALKLFEE